MCCPRWPEMLPTTPAPCMQVSLKATMLRLPTLLQAVLLVVAVLSGVHGLGLPDPSATSELQQGRGGGLHVDSHAIEDPMPLGAAIQDQLEIAGRNLLRRRRRRSMSPPAPRPFTITSTAQVDGTGTAAASGIDSSTSFTALSETETDAESASATGSVESLASGQEASATSELSSVASIFRS